MKRMTVHLDEHRGEHLQICSVLWTDKYWVMSHSKEHLKRMLKDLIAEAERLDLEPKTCELVVAKYV